MARIRRRNERYVNENNTWMFVRIFFLENKKSSKREVKMSRSSIHVHRDCYIFNRIEKKNLDKVLFLLVVKYSLSIYREEFGRI